MIIRFGVGGVVSHLARCARKASSEIHWFAMLNF